MRPASRPASLIRPAALALTAVAVAPAAVLATGCGGTGGSPKSRYLARANAVCRDQTEAIGRLPAPAIDLAHARRDKLKLMAAYFDQAVPIVRTHFRRLSALTPPPADADRVARLLAGARELLDLLGALDREAHAGDVAAFRADLRAAGRASSDSHALALQYGLGACAR